MLRLGGVVIPMQQNFNEKEAFNFKNVKFLIGDAKTIQQMENVRVKKPFDESIITFVDDFSKRILKDKEAKNFPDVVTLGFWLRKSSVLQMKERFTKEDGCIHLGRGVVFHIAPSNVAVNYLYSMMSALLMGNANIVRVSSKEFPQVDILNRLLHESILEYKEFSKYIALVKYERSQLINDYFSNHADVRVIWGGDQTIAELRKSPLKPRATEITFADRYSLAVIDSDSYMDEDALQIAQKFYNDTYLSDQNACTSPRVVIWTGGQIAEAKERFWNALWKLVSEKYSFQPIMGVNKLTSAYMAAVQLTDAKVIPVPDSRIVRIEVSELNDDLMQLRDNSGFFFEYDCANIMDLVKLCDDVRVQTISMVGNAEMLRDLVESGIRGIDRIVPVGSSMDFDLIWDGYDLSERLTRSIVI